MEKLDGQKKRSNLALNLERKTPKIRHTKFVLDLVTSSFLYRNNCSNIPLFSRNENTKAITEIVSELPLDFLVELLLSFSPRSMVPEFHIRADKILINKTLSLVSQK